MKRFFLGIVIVAFLVAGVSAQNAVGTRAGYRTHQQLGAYLELGIVNPVSFYLMPTVLFPRDTYDLTSITMGLRVYPFDGRDLGFPGYPQDRRDFGHQISFFGSAGVQLAILTAKVDRVRDYQLDNETELVLFTPFEVGVRWYLFRTLVFTRQLLLDNMFLEVPLGYTLNVSSLTGVFDYEDALDDEFDPFYAGIAVGFTF